MLTEPPPSLPPPSLAEAGDAGVPMAVESPLDFIGAQRLPLEAGARVRPPVAGRVNAELFAGHPRVRSVLTKGLKVRVPSTAPRVWHVTRRSALMTAAVTDCVAAGVLVPGRPRRCYRLFPVPKNKSVARLIYDMSSLTPFLPHRPCVLPTIERALEAAANGFNFGLKIDLRDGFFHIPLAESTRENFGVSYEGQEYVFARLPMGISIAPSEMQHFACVTVKLVEARFPGVNGMVYLDDFLFLARCPRDLIGISEFLSGAGFCLNLEKSVLTPTSDLIFLGIDLDLMAGTARVKAGVLPALRAAVSACSPSWPLLKRQRLAGFVNFVRPCLKLPLEIVSAVRDGDSGACAAVLPFMGDDVMLSHDDVRACVDVHSRQVFVDATPSQIGIVRPGCTPVSVALTLELPIYVAEYAAALTAICCSGDEVFTIFSDNMGVVYNLHKGRCPRSWLPLLCHIFRSRKFSVRYISSDANPADAPSRAFCS